MLVELTTEQELAAGYEVVKELRKSLNLKGFIEKVADCRRRGNYRLFAWEVAGQYVACCGVMPMPTLYYTDCLWVAELVVRERDAVKLLADSSWLLLKSGRKNKVIKK